MVAQRTIEGQEGQTAARTYTARQTGHRTLRVDKVDGGYIELGAGHDGADTAGAGRCPECADGRAVPCRCRAKVEGVARDDGR